MFGRKDSADTMTQENPTQSPVVARPGVPAEHAAAARSVPAPSPVPAAARRSLDMPHGNSRRSERGDSGEPKKLIVGRGLSLSGEIAACDMLVVEGKVEARLTDGKMLEITESGQFRGSVEIESADIAGRYDGELTVHGRLTVRGTGRVSGVVKYGELEINAGGQIIGELHVIGENTGSSSNKGTFRNAAKFTALMDEDEEAIDQAQAQPQSQPQAQQQRRA